MIALVVFVSSDRPYSFSMLQRCHCTCHLPNLKNLEIIEHLMKSADICPTFVHLSNQATSIRSSVISGVGAEVLCKASVTLSFDKFVQSVFSLICAKRQQTSGAFFVADTGYFAHKFHHLSDFTYGVRRFTLPDWNSSRGLKSRGWAQCCLSCLCYCRASWVVFGQKSVDFRSSNEGLTRNVKGL